MYPGVTSDTAWPAVSSISGGSTRVSALGRNLSKEESVLVSFAPFSVSTAKAVSRTVADADAPSAEEGCLRSGSSFSAPSLSTSLTSALSRSRPDAASSDTACFRLRTAAAISSKVFSRSSTSSLGAAVEMPPAVSTGSFA